ncbi:phage terminase large subunit [Beijerinckia sp. L45]|uniref:phage terminase large subunit n=1 Tax=Beijerinckia sp. L45 TaxID=1641855 RepID=UPI00131C976A|nr:phage terminase large subunit [Beijerinckia sp. L45]
MVSFSAGQEAARALLEGSQRYTCLAGGTRSGKTFLIVRSIVERAILAPGSHHVILRFHANAAHASIALDTLPTVTTLCFPGVTLKESRQDGFFKLTNGSRIAVGGLDDKDRVEKILGLEYVTVFLNEASQIPYTSALVAFTRLAQVVGDLPQRAYVDLNPTHTMHWTNTLFGDKRDPVSRQPLSDPEQYARAFINPRDNADNLSPAYLESLAHLPERQRKRFYEGVYVEAVDDALWSFEIIERYRCAPEAIPLEKRMGVVVAVDPSGAAGRDDLGADEIGIVVAAKHEDGDCYILADRSCREAPAVWSRRAVAAFHEFKADCIVAESNYGGEMVRATIHAADANVPVTLVTASRGKAVRAEPISLLYEDGRVHHVGRFPKLEEQLCAFSASGYGGHGSPDHADAAIWAVTHLLGKTDTAIIEFYRRMSLDRN